MIMWKNKRRKYPPPGMDPMQDIVSQADQGAVHGDYSFRNHSRQPFFSVFQPFQGRFRSFRGLFLGRAWYERAARNARNNRYVILKLLICSLSVIVALAETAFYAPIKDQAIIYLVSAALFLVLDPLECLNRYFAPQSQIILAFDCIVGIVMILRPARSCFTVSGLILSGSLTMIYMLNTSWLGIYNWRMTESVQTAMRLDLDNKASRNWQADGRRQIHTLLLDLGFDNSDFALDTVYRSVYICGYLNGYVKTVKQKSRLETAETKAEEHMRELKDCRQKLDEALRALKESETETVQALQDFREADDAAKYWQKLYAAECKRSRQLEQANEELVSTLPDPIAAVQFETNQEAEKEKTMEEIVLDCLAQGMSYSQAGKAAGCSKSKAFRIKQQYDQEQPADTAGAADPDKIVVLTNDNKEGIEAYG